MAASTTHFAAVATSCALAALIVDRFVVASLLTPRASMRRVTVEVADTTRNGDAHDEVRISRIVRDGTLVRFDTQELNGEWEQTGDPKYPQALRRSGPASSISFDASQAIVEFVPSPLSSQATLRSGGDPLQHVDLQAPRWGLPNRILGTSGRRGHWWTFVAVAAAIVGLAFVVRPLRDSRRAQIWWAWYLTVIHLAVWASVWIGTNEDSLEYADNWFKNVQGYPQYFPPGYGMFLAFADLIPFMDKGSAAALLQHAMMIATLLWIYRLLLRLVPSAVASLWLVVSSVLTPSLFLPQMIQSENLAVFTMAAAVYFAHGRSAPSALFGGMSLGFSVIAKAVPIVAAPALLLMQVRVRPSQRRMRMLAIVAGAALVIACPVVWFGAHGQAPVLTDSVGLHLYQRVQEQNIFAPSGISTARVLTRLPGIQLRVIDPWDLREALSESDLPMAEAHNLVGAVAQEGIRAHPADFFRYSFLVAWRIFFGDPCHFINWFARSPVPAPDLETPRPLPTTAAGIETRLFLDWVFGHVWTAVCWLAIVGVMCLPLARDRALAFTLAWIPAAYILTTGFVEVSLPRYNVAVTPFITATAFLPFGVIATWFGESRTPAINESRQGPI